MSVFPPGDSYACDKFQKFSAIIGYFKPIFPILISPISTRLSMLCLPDLHQSSFDKGHICSAGLPLILPRLKPIVCFMISICLYVTLSIFLKFSMTHLLFHISHPYHCVFSSICSDVVQPRIFRICDNFSFACTPSNITVVDAFPFVIKPLQPFSGCCVSNAIQ